jgi:ribosomal subunit interface protein
MTNIIITGKDFKLTSPLKAYVTRKMTKISRLSSLRLEEIKIELDFDKNQKSGLIYRTEMSVQLPGTMLKAGQKGHSMQEAINLCIPKLIEQVTKYKDKKLSRKKGHHERQRTE